jgi:hypothetical protein
MANRHTIQSAISIFLFMASGYLTKAQKTDRFLEFRGGDSVWVIKTSLLSRSKFFIGNQRVNFTIWQDHLQEEDVEISKFIKKGTGLRRASTGIVLGGLAAITAGIIIQSNSQASGNVNEEKRTVGRVTTGLGIAATGIALLLGQQAWAFYHKAMRLYNIKVHQPPKQQLSINLLIDPFRASIQIRW